MIIVVSVICTQSVKVRKEKLYVITRIKNKAQSRIQFVTLVSTTAELTASDIFNRAYEIVWKGELTNLFEEMTNSDGRYTDELILWILKEPNVLDFLYGVWQHTDFLLTSEINDLLYDELLVRKGGANEYTR